MVNSLEEKLSIIQRQKKVMIKCVEIETNTSKKEKYLQKISLLDKEEQELLNDLL